MKKLRHKRVNINFPKLSVNCGAMLELEHVVSKSWLPSINFDCWISSFLWVNICFPLYWFIHVAKVEMFFKKQFSYYLLCETSLVLCICIHFRDHAYILCLFVLPVCTPEGSTWSSNFITQVLAQCQAHDWHSWNYFVKKN